MAGDELRRSPLACTHSIFRQGLPTFGGAPAQPSPGTMESDNSGFEGLGRPGIAAVQRDVLRGPW